MAGEYICAWHVFQGSNFLLLSRASAAVLFDSKQRKVHVPAKLKVRCTFCACADENRGLCVHELQKLNEIASRSRYMELTGIEKVVESDIGEPVVCTGSPEQLQPKAYTSTRTRQFFHCASEKNAVLRIIIEAKKYLVK